MSYLLYVGVTLLIAVVDSFYKDAPGYTLTNIALRVVVLLPLLSSITEGASQYARVLRRTLWLVMVADVLLPLYFPAGMVAFLVVHVLNVRNFWRYAEIRRGRTVSVVVPGVAAYGASVFLYCRFLYPSMDDVFRVMVGLYLVPIASALSLSVTVCVQKRARWSVLAGMGMFLFFCTDFQVAAEFLTDISIPCYGLVNALTYYGGLLLLSLATRLIRD